MGELDQPIHVMTQAHTSIVRPLPSYGRGGREAYVAVHDGDVAGVLGEPRLDVRAYLYQQT